MKKTAIFMACLLVACMLTGCCIIHDWQSATCEKPGTCSKCGETKGVATGHNWTIQSATCTEDKSCTNCGKIEERATGHRWKEATETSPRMCTNCNEMYPLELPENGQVFIGKDAVCDSRLTIRSSTTNSCYIKLKDSNGEDVYSFFVRAGETVRADVPGGSYYVYFAYGDDWYGTEYIFGPETTYAKDDEICDFSKYTFEYTLYPSYGGNFSETPISGSDF